MKKLFPTTLPSFPESLGRRKSFDKCPWRRDCPIVKSLQSCRIVLIKSLSKLVDQCGTLLDKLNFIPAKQTQFLNLGVFGFQLPPAMPVGS
jgi:hypothetical protein